MTYSEKLKHPKWQKKRLQILNRDNFQCQDCNNKEETLQVHHKYYIYGRDPWDYPDDLLITLCESCHNWWEDNKDIIGDFTKVLLNRGLTPSELKKIHKTLIMVQDHIGITPDTLPIIIKSIETGIIEYCKFDLGIDIDFDKVRKNYE